VPAPSQFGNVLDSDLPLEEASALIIANVILVTKANMVTSVTTDMVTDLVTKDIKHFFVL
jgi:hypothetical protein